MRRPPADAPAHQPAVIELSSADQAAFFNTCLPHFSLSHLSLVSLAHLCCILLKLVMMPLPCLCDPSHPQESDAALLYRCLRSIMASQDIFGGSLFALASSVVGLARDHTSGFSQCTGSGLLVAATLNQHN
jgi:hypothetical protein